MLRIFSTFLIVMVALAAMAQQADPVAVLQSDADFPAKAAACRQLARTGGAEAVPALEALLADEKLNHMARYALESIPAPEAGAALRRALPLVSELQQVGIMSTLAARGDEQAIEPIVRILMEGNPVTGPEAARAVSRLVSPDAEPDLTRMQQEPGALAALADDLLNFAERALEGGNIATATALFDLLREADPVPAPVQDGALRGAIVARGVAGIPLLVQALHTEDADTFDAAIRAARELARGEEVDAALGAELAKLPAWAQVPVMQALGERGGSAAGPDVLALAREGETEVRIAAVQAVTRMAYEPALETIEQLTYDEDGPVAEAARDALIYFPGGRGDTILLGMLDRSDAQTRAAAVDLVARGGLAEPLAPLMRIASSDADEAVRVAALKALRGFAGRGEVPALLDRLVKAASEVERQATENVLQSICQRERQTTSGSVEVVRAAYGDLPDGAQKDVTDQVTAMLAQGKASVEATNGNFGDPAGGTVKKLTVDYKLDGVPATVTVRENETLTLAATAVPTAIVDQLRAALGAADGPTEASLLRILGATGHPTALEAVALAAAAGGPASDTACRVLCDWPSADALDLVLALTQNAPSAELKTLALRGAMRLLGDGAGAVAGYGKLLAEAAGPADRKLLLSGLGRVAHPGALALALEQAADPDVRAEALLAAGAIDKALGDDRGREDQAFLKAANWEPGAYIWAVQDGLVTGHNPVELLQNEFLWSKTPVGDFYLELDVKLEPNSANAGIQFRSVKVDDHGQAKGYQADVGQGWWGKLYHEHGRGLLDDSPEAEAALKPGEWNHYEVLAVGRAVWIAINGTVGTAFLDPAPDAELTGSIALQVHSGPPQTVQYRLKRLVHDPALKLANQDAAALLEALK